MTLRAEKVLGIDLGGRRDKTDKEYWDKLVEKLGSKLKIWKGRDLSLEGKTYIIKSGHCSIDVCPRNEKYF